MEETLLEALRNLLINGEAGTQENICAALMRQGLEINQSKVSRLLRKIGAVKVVNPKGQTVYSFPRDPAPPGLDTSLKGLVMDVVANETLVIILTSPGSASMVARILEHLQVSAKILGTVAGDDTIFVVPKSIKDIEQIHIEIRNLLKG